MTIQEAAEPLVSLAALWVMYRAWRQKQSV